MHVHPVRHGTVFPPKSHLVFSTTARGECLGCGDAASSRRDLLAGAASSDTLTRRLTSQAFGNRFFSALLSDYGVLPLSPLLAEIFFAQFQRQSNVRSFVATISLNSSMVARATGRAKSDATHYEKTARICIIFLQRMWDVPPRNAEFLE